MNDSPANFWMGFHLMNSSLHISWDGWVKFPVSDARKNSKMRHNQGTAEEEDLFAKQK